MKANLKDTKARAKASFAALQSELRGSAGATPARYSTWPIGCMVRVTTGGQPANVGGSVGDASEPEGFIATLASYDRVLNSFEVKLDDGSTRTVPAQRVTRARPRDRAQAPTNLAGPAVRSPMGHDVQSKDHGVTSVASNATRNNDKETPWNMFDFSHQEVPPQHSQRPPMQRPMSLQHVVEAANSPFSPNQPEPSMFGLPQMSGHPYDIERVPPSPTKNEPQMLGRPHSLLD